MGEGKYYINCPLTKAEFVNWVNELVNSEVVQLHHFEKEIYFEGCMPIEVMAKRIRESLLFSSLKPVGLSIPNREPLCGSPTVPR
ncbi:hypothetical protein P344_02525 [Spiroplasma mirum ATCC 29335]|uniref:MnmG N-terminal domain-containing protein n=1 Tax=Spiroplasma mirum ATCC 29335 TaxID=838561 RepID=W6AL08_9MOLU|nr:hypothetical protein P344_02525 [Spiroplasma mirum ATCC 29335]